jgi:RNA polymerase sigma-70 factor, ECF subfamily
MKTDAELVAGALAGSQEACRELVTRFERPVFSVIYRMVRDEGTAEDLAQESFVKAFRSLGSYDHSRKFASWLFKIAHNTTIDHLRRTSLDTVPLEPGKAPGGEEKGGLAAVLADETLEAPDARAERHDLGRALERAVARLRPEYREAVLLFYGEGVPYQEICEITGLPMGTLKTHLHRARKELAQAMRDMGFAPAGT